jgi:hypothetical protein
MLTMRGLVAAVLVGVVGCGGVAAGQDEAKPKNVVKEMPKQPEPPPPPEFTLTVDFAGGTVGQYIEALKKAAGRNAVNIVGSRAVLDMQMAPVALRDVSAYAAVQAVSGAAATTVQDGQWNVHGLGLGGSGRTEGYSLEYFPRQRAQVMTSAPSNGIRVFSIRDLTEPMPGDPPGAKLTKSPEVVLTAVRAALDLVGDQGDAPAMKFHEDSGLLIIHGQPDHVGAVDQALEQMRDDLRRRRQAARENPGPRVDVDGLRTEVRRSEVKMGQAARDIERSAVTRDRLKKMVDGGQASSADLSDAEAKVDEARVRMELSQIELDRFQGMLKAAEQARGSDGGGAKLEDRIEQTRGQLSRVNEELSREQQGLKALKDKGLPDENREVKQVQARIDGLSKVRDQIVAEMTRLTRDAAAEAGVPAGKSVAIYDLPPMDARAREQLISAIRGLEAAINNPEKLKLQSVQGDSKLVIEADGAMHVVVRGMVKEVAGARGDREPEKPKGDGGGRPPKPAGGR